MATTLPEAMEMTGICREISGLTVPVTLSVEVELYSVAVARGNRRGQSTVIRVTPPSLSTCTGGGACAAGSCFWPPQPLNIQKLRTAAGTTACLVKRPHQPMQDSDLSQAKL